jgi:hypothetical protein
MASGQIGMPNASTSLASHEVIPLVDTAIHDSGTVASRHTASDLIPATAMALAGVPVESQTLRASVTSPGPALSVHEAPSAEIQRGACWSNL